MDLKKRLSAVINKDKASNPKYLNNVIKSDFYYLISNYFEVNFEDVVVDIDLKNEKYIIGVKCKGDRVKMINSLPD